MKDCLLLIRTISIKNSISEKCSDIRSIPFSTYAEEFKIIDSETVSVVVERDDESRRLIEDIKNTGFGNHRKLQKYAFSVYRNEFELLLNQHVIDDYGSGIWCLKSLDYYDEDIGVIFEGNDYFVD